MIRKETYTQNNLNPDICDEAILYADREPTEEELFYIRFEYLLTHKNECRRYLIRRLFLPLPV